MVNDGTPADGETKLENPSVPKVDVDIEANAKEGETDMAGDIGPIGEKEQDEANEPGKEEVMVSGQNVTLPRYIH